MMSRTTPHSINDPGPIDKDWFLDRMAQRKMTVTATAKLMGMHKSALSLMLNNERKMSVHEAGSLARILGVPVGELLGRAGVYAAGGLTQCPIVETVDREGLMFSLDRDDDRTSYVPLPVEMPDNTRAVRCEDPNTSRYGWVFYYTPTDRVEADAVGKWCVCDYPDGLRRIRSLRPGFEKSHYNLVGWDTKDVERDVALARAAPISWVRM